MLYQIEKFRDIRHEVQPLIENHWQEIAINQDKIKLNPVFDDYVKMCDAGTLKIFTVRKDNTLVGYFACIVNVSLHYADHKFANCDVLFLTKKYRKGLIGYNLINHAINYLKQYNVSVLNINTKVHAPFDPLMERMGFDLIERVYSKYIGE